MMSSHSPLATRMKAHEHVTRLVLPPRAYTIVRVDGRAFHSYTRGLQRPFDATFAADMDDTAAALCGQVSGAVLGYVQSDEISLLLTDFATEATQPWFGGVTAKLTSLSAAAATAALIARRPPAEYGRTPLFDSRAFTLPTRADVLDYFVWRQRDAVNNSVAMAAQTHFSPTRLHGLHTGQLRAKLADEAGVRWEDYPAGFRYGRVVVREEFTGPISYFHKGEQVTKTDVVTRHRWATRPAEEFTGDPSGWLADRIPVHPDHADVVDVDIEQAS